MQYLAIAHTLADGRTEIEFPDAPGCVAVVERKQKLLPVATEALEGWLEAHLTMRDRVPPAPKKNRRVPTGTTAITVTVAPILSAKVALRRARLARELTQEGLAERLGVKQAQVSKLESPDYPSTLSSLQRAAEALGAVIDVNIELCPEANAS
jgi:predicted RNase H-like HicB family nuclease/DNA-binding XRE family transcriptional regulator